MRKLEELKHTDNLCVIGQLTRFPEKHEVYEGRVDWHGMQGHVIFGFNENGLMEHVSLCPDKKNQMPTWNDMCKLKDIFFDSEEMVVQIHPAESRYVHGIGIHNRRENILHLWRPKDGNFEILNHPERWD